MASGKTVIAFDLYGTLLSTDSIAKELATHFGHDKAQEVASLWRRYQLEYTWRLNSMGIYRSFNECTRGALQHAVTELGLTLSSTDESDLMRAYNSLHTFPEVAGALERAAENDMVDVYIFSNGTDDMIRASVTTSPDLKPHAGLFKDMISVEEVQVFKPTRNSYTHLQKRVGKEEGADDLWLVSANPFDVIGAKAAGLRVAWIDRAGKGWADRLGDVIGGLKPDIIANGVDKAVLEIMDASRK